MASYLRNTFLEFGLHGKGAPKRRADAFSPLQFMSSPNLLFNKIYISLVV